MRALNSFVQQRLLDDPLRYYGLVDVQMTSGYYYFTSLPYDITVSSQTYQSDGGLVGFAAPRQSSNVDREAFKFDFTDNTGALKNEIQRSLAGNPIKLRLAFFNPDGTPNTDPNNMLVSYEGYIDAVSYSNDFEEAMLRIEASSPMADLSMSNGIYVSADGMDQYDGLDTAFDKVIDQNENNIKWGKQGAVSSIAYRRRVSAGGSTQPSPFPVQNPNSGGVQQTTTPQLVPGPNGGFVFRPNNDR